MTYITRVTSWKATEERLVKQQSPLNQADIALLLQPWTSSSEPVQNSCTLASTSLVAIEVPKLFTTILNKRASAKSS